MQERFRQIENKIVKDFVQQALKSGYWIYEPGCKRWRTPEEFIQQYLENKLHLKDGWQANYKIMNPRKGLVAADTLVKQLIEKRTDFENKVLDYYMNKNS